MRLNNLAPRPAHIKWLLDSDPSIRWQAMRDLTGAPPDAIAAERARVAIRKTAGNEQAGTSGTPAKQVEDF